MITRFTSFVVLLVSLSAVLAAHARDDHVFPPELTVSDRGESYELALTGQAERVFLFFRIYEIAHYMQVADRPLLAPDTVVADGPPKAIVITFARKLGREKIRDEFSKSLRRNAQPDWLARAEPTIADFISAIDRDALVGDQLVFYWLAGGRVVAEFNSEQAFSVTDTAFAKLIWSIWFGDDPACDSEELLARATSTVEL